MKLREYFVHFYNRQNFGDDLFIYLLAVKNRSVLFHIHGPRKYKKTFRDLKNVCWHSDGLHTRAINGLSRIQGFVGDFVQNRRAKKTDGVIYIGGSLFMEPNDPAERARFFRYNRFLRTEGLPLYICGANFGPWTSPGFHRFFSDYFETCAWISFRDKKSQELFSELSSVHQFPDIGFLLGNMKNGVSDRPEISNDGRKTAVVSLIGAERLDEPDRYLNWMVRQVKKLTRRYEVYLVSCSREQGDLESCHSVFRQCTEDEKKRIRVVDYDGNIREILEMIKAASLVFGTRFHSIVTALSLGTPVIPIVYSQKTEEMLNDAGFQGLKLYSDHLPEEVFDPENLNSGFLEKNRFPADRRKELADEAYGHFGFLNEKKERKSDAKQSNQ